MWQELVAMKLTREQVNAIRKRLDANRDRALRETGDGTYRVVPRPSVTLCINPCHFIDG